MQWRCIGEAIDVFFPVVSDDFLLKIGVEKSASFEYNMAHLRTIIGKSPENDSVQIGLDGQTLENLLE